jgi:hypothetical protein
MNRAKTANFYKNKRKLEMQKQIQKGPSAGGQLSHGNLNHASGAERDTCGLLYEIANASAVVGIEQCGK